MRNGKLLKNRIANKMGAAKIPSEFAVAERDRENERERETEERKRHVTVSIEWEEKKSLSLLGRKRERLPENLENYCHKPPRKRDTRSSRREKKYADATFPRATRQMWI